MTLFTQLQRYAVHRARAGGGRATSVASRLRFWRYASALDQTLAGAVIVHPDMAARVPTGTVAILTSEPYAGWARVAALFYPGATGFSRYSPVRNCR